MLGTCARTLRRKIALDVPLQSFQRCLNTVEKTMMRHELLQWAGGSKINFYPFQGFGKQPGFLSTYWKAVTTFPVT